MSKCHKMTSKIYGVEFTHALLFPPVLELIFNDLELKDLRICRLVCQRWNSISLLQLKNRKVRISLREEDRLNQFLNNETGFSEFRRFKFTYSIESEPNLVKFMNMSKIQLQDVTFVIGKNEDVNLNLMDKFLTFLTENSRNFESFGIEIREETCRVPPTLVDIESFQINWTQLKSLAIWKVTDSPIFLPILDRASKLERLVIMDGPPYSTYRPSLDNLIPSLIELELNESCVSPEPELHYILGASNDTLPQFTKLKRLSLSRRLSRRYDMTIPSLLELTELYLSAWLRFEELTIFPKLKSLNWNNGKYHVFPNKFPNLKSLQTSKIQTPLDWKYLRGIEELNLTSSYTNDRDIIGFDLDLSPPDNAEFNDHDPYKGCAEWSVIYKLDKCSKHENTQSGVQLLSELKWITISGNRISNATIIFGLLKCKSLRSVRLLSPSLYLTKEILVWMADELNLMYLSIAVSHREWYSSNEAIYFRQKHPNCQLVFPYYPTPSSRFTY